MAARRQQDEIGKDDIGGEPRGQRVRLQVVDRDEWLSGREGDAFSGHQSDQDPADQTRPRGCGDAVKLFRPDPRFEQRACDQRIDDLDVGARRDFRHDAAEGGMRRNLAHHFVGKNFA